MTVKAIIHAVKDEKWCRLLTVLMRLTVGGVFIFSGFVKAVDPWGTCYKFTDYFHALGLGQWDSTALLLAVALAAAEFMLGIALAVGAYRRSAPVAALLMILVMLPLTLWIAVTGAVGDCGCFGDALHLTGWATFFKNVLLLLGIIYLLCFNKWTPGVYGPAVQWMVMAVSFAFVMAVAYYGYFYQPLIDFRPYPIGTLLADAVEDSDESDDEFVFVYRKDGREQTFTLDSLPDEDDGWEFVTRYHAKRPHGKVIVQQPGAAGGIAIMDDDGNNIAPDLLSSSRQTLLLLFPDLPQVGVINSYTLNELYDVSQLNGTQVIGLTSADALAIDAWRDLSMAAYPIYNMDDSEIKMVARGNPAVVYLQDGAIVWKRTLSSLDGVAMPDHFGELQSDYDADRIMTALLLAYLAALLAVLALNRTHLVVKAMISKLRISLIKRILN